MIQININAEVSPIYNFNQKIYEIFYPCELNYECYPYEISLTRGIYLFELYGASGGIPSKLNTTTSRRSTEDLTCIPDLLVKSYKGNTECNPSNSPGSGAYIAGILPLKQKTKFFAHIGGSGSYKIKGGYNGGGDAGSSASSGGGATDIRVGSDDIFHRIIVAGGGGGSDDYHFDGLTNDGAGGAGGYPESQGYWEGGYYVHKPASQTSGYEFGQGESGSIPSVDTAGAGGGWYGGFGSNSGNAGAGGGSSFLLSKDAIIPEDVGYAFDTSSPYTMRLFAHESGIWSGNGKIVITILSEDHTINQCYPSRFIHSLFLIIFL